MYFVSRKSLPGKRAAAALLALVLAAGCKREQRDYSAPPGQAGPASAVPVTDLVPGMATASQPAAVIPASFHNDYEKNAFALSEGQRIYEQYNCVTCHAHGGGDIGPPLIDDKWIYGFRPEQVYASIVQGRPNGMPAFGTRLNQQQTWQLTAYVRSMSGQASKDAAPGRPDHMQNKPPEHSTPATQPVNSATPAGAERPE
jgi:cytochrome c oxidase cbb3-type subunit 3